MTDVEITELCAEAMGWKHLGAIGILPLEGEEKRDYAKRGDAYGKLWCYSGQNDWWLNPEGHNVCGPCQGIPDPLHNDEHAMALVKKLDLSVVKNVPGFNGWAVGQGNCENDKLGESENLNRAICECVAKMQAAIIETVSLKEKP